MASTPPVTNYQHSEIPPWKIELIQRKKRHQGTMSPNSSNGNNGINNGHRSITHPESDVNTGKFIHTTLILLSIFKWKRWHMMIQLQCRMY